MLPCGEHGDHLLCDLFLGKKHPEHLLPEDGLQLFQLQRRGDAEHALFAVKTAIRRENVSVRSESEEIAEGLHGNDGAGDGIRGHLAARCPHHLLEKDLQGFSGRAAQIGKKLPVVQEISTQNLRDTEDEMPVRYLLEEIHAEPGKAITSSPKERSQASAGGYPLNMSIMTSVSSRTINYSYFALHLAVCGRS
jgi:hypothetical protein